MEKKEYETLGQYLDEYFVHVYAPRHYDEKRERASEKNFADWLGLNNQNYSQYKLGTRRPSVEQADKMATRLGPLVYDLLGMPRRMPKDPLLHLIADNLPDLTDEDKKEIAEIVRNKLAEKESRRPKRKGALI